MSEKKKKINSWIWQMQNRITSAKSLVEFRPDLKNHILIKQYQDFCANKNRHDDVLDIDLNMAISPYYANLIDAKDPKCVILLQTIPSKKETIDDLNKIPDPLAEEINMPVRGLTHRYPDRVLWYTTHSCAVYCRYCMRKRKVSNPQSAPTKKEIDQIITYIQNNVQIKEVILSGGDPLSLSDDLLQLILGKLSTISHIKSIRIHTRMLVTLPMRITKKLCEIFKKFYPLTIVTHFNHPVEITKEARETIQKLKFSGISVLNQSVLLKSINDDVNTMEILLMRLIEVGVLPYYLHRCDEIPGNSHFQVPLERGLDILEKIRGKNPGIAIPRYMIDLPGGGGKIPIEVDYKTPKDHIFIKNGVKYQRFYNSEKIIFTISEIIP